MAYRRSYRTTRRSGRSRAARGSARSRGTSRARTTRARSRSRTVSRPQELRIVIEQTQGSPISRHLGLATKINPPPKKARL